MLNRWSFITTKLAQEEIRFSLARFHQETTPVRVNRTVISDYKEILSSPKTEIMPARNRSLSVTKMLEVEHPGTSRCYSGSEFNERTFTQEAHA
jgi:hypothetical protein